MSTDLRSGQPAGGGAGSGTLVDVLTSVTLEDTRIRGFAASGIGTFAIKASNNIIKFTLTTASDANSEIFTDAGFKMIGNVSVSAPTSASTLIVFYG
jgi:hypothetical protein|tara:strand:+ start:10443 stop:10733 length:291 start_codon:yes stop_codon:yes gene_type:complete